VAEGAARLRAGTLDAYATNKPTLFRMAETVPGSRVLPGRWGAERMALALPPDRAGALPWLGRFTGAALQDGLVRQAIDRAGLRGALPEDDPATRKGDAP
jgi:polar amino acid transport system substrate-binding protein